MPEGFVDIEVRKEILKLPQAALVANELLEEWSKKHEYKGSKIVPRLWKHRCW